MNPEPARQDVLAGMLVYTVPGGRVQATLRDSVEDFRVSEIFDLGKVEKEKREGYVPVYRLSKLGIDTPHAAERLGQVLKSRVNFAGLKDSKAATTQYVTPRSVRAEDPESVRGEGFEAQRVGYLERPISRGMISGNAFQILVRTSECMSETILLALRLASERRLPNFFGYQRFGLKGMVNQRIGKAIVKRDFRGAVELLLWEPREGENRVAAEARKIAGSGDYRTALRALTPGQDIERRALSRLESRPGDWLGALRRVPLLPRRLFVQSYQAYLFNLTLSGALGKGLQIEDAERGDNWAELLPDGLSVSRPHGVREPAPDGAIPLVQVVGFAFRDYSSRFDECAKAVLAAEGVSPASFYLKEAEELSGEGGFRHAPLVVRDASVERVEKGLMLRFSLGKGEYATTLLREVLKPENPLASGF